MIETCAATKYIADELNKLKQSGQIKGKVYESKSSISIYFRTNDPTNPPQKYFRSSNHHPTYATLIRKKGKPWNTVNISVEFDETRRNKNGKKLDNRWNDIVKQNAKGTVQPFSIDVYEYKASMLEDFDIPIIFNAIKTFAMTGTYTDPFAGTPKAAKHTRRPAKIKPFKQGAASASTAPSNAAKTTASATTSPSAKTMTESTKKECSSKPIKITRKELVSIVKNCVEKVIQQRRKAALKPIRRDGYDDNPVVGWNFEEDFEREHGSGDHEIEASRKLYGKYGRECAQMGKRPDAWGFDIWRRNRAWESLKPLEKRP